MDLICKGTITLGTGCLNCDSCVDESKRIIEKFKKMPLKDIPIHHRGVLFVATSIMISSLGNLEKFSEWIRGSHGG